MTIQDVKRQARNVIEKCLHDNNQSIIFQIRVLRKLKSTRFCTKYEIEILDLTDKQKEVLKNKLELYAQFYQTCSNTWYFYFINNSR